MGKKIRPWQSVPDDLFFVKYLFCSPPPSLLFWNFFISLHYFLWFPRSSPSIPSLSNYEKLSQLEGRPLVYHYVQSKGGMVGFIFWALLLVNCPLEEESSFRIWGEGRALLIE